MPLVRIDIPAETSPDVASHVADIVHQAMVSVLNIPITDRFQTITLRNRNALICTDEFLGIKHSDQIVLIQITLAPRTVDLKKALFMEMASRIGQQTAFLASDVIINLVETPRENWSFGNGIAQFS
jgi:4-oxalocrotonate tautomerase